MRPVVESDLPALLEVNASDEVTALLPYATWTSMADGEAWLERMRGIEATGLALQFVATLKATGKAIGTCLLFRLEEKSARAEIGYALGRDAGARASCERRSRLSSVMPSTTWACADSKPRSIRATSRRRG